MTEILRSNKLNKSSNNQLYLYSKKARGSLRTRDPSSRANTGIVNHDMKIYAEYRAISTDPGDSGNFFFKKTMRFPSNYFSSATMPVCFVCLQTRGDTVHKINSLIRNPTSNSYVLRSEAQAGTPFDNDMDYHANILAISTSNVTDLDPTIDFMPVDWGADDEELQISSLAMNQMAINTDYLYHRRIKSALSNADYISKAPNYTIRYLNSNILMYAAYVEFNPLNDTFDKDDNTDGDSPKKFIRNFDFPSPGNGTLFKPTAHPVVIANVGAKIDADSGTIRKIGSILRNVHLTGFSLEIYEMSTTQEFATTDTYFCSYVAIGEGLEAE